MFTLGIDSNITYNIIKSAIKMYSSKIDQKWSLEEHLKTDVKFNKI